MSNSKDLISKRKDRAIAIILGVKERECDESLSDAQSFALRKVILDQINDLYDFVLDVALNDTDGMLVNQVYLDKIDELHEKMVNGD